MNHPQFESLTSMTALEHTLQQQLNAAQLKGRHDELQGSKYNIRRQLRSLFTACSLIAGGFSEGEDWTREDELRARTLSGLEPLEDRLVAELTQVQSDLSATTTALEALASTNDSSEEE